MQLSVWSPHAKLVAIVAATVFGVDQLTKLWILFGLGLLEVGQIPLLPFFDLTMVWNYGISYGLFQQDGNLGRYVLVAIKIIAALALWFWAGQTPSKLMRVAMACIIGGALGNAVDRVAYGAVADFAHLHWGEFSWYVFNVADAAIVVGVLLMLYDAFVRGEQKPADA
ncbi:MAG: signal peptidase II [Pseudomonadota bacterium]